MEIPDRITQALDGESVQSAVSLGDEDIICFTPTRTLLYRGEGLLSDEAIESYSHDIERVNISEGRRKTTFALEYVDSVKKFKITSKRTEQVLTRLLAGVLGTAGILDEEESVQGVFRFSELTIIVTDARLVKHIGAYVWDPDFEEYHYSDVTGLEFEEGNVATQIVISIDGRKDRIKAPSDEARKLQRALTSTLFAYHEVDSLDALNEKIGQEDGDTADASATDNLGLDDNISPLVSDDADDESSTTEDATAASGDDGSGDGETTLLEPEDGGETTAVVTDTAVEVADGESSDSDATRASPAVDPEVIDELRTEIELLAEAVETQQDQLDEQSKQIKRQRETIQQLIEELRQHT